MYDNEDSRVVISDAARRIADDSRGWTGTGQSGWLVYGTDGTGGAWYSPDTPLSALESPDTVVIPCGGISAWRAQVALNNAADRWSAP